MTRRPIRELCGPRFWMFLLSKWYWDFKLN